MWSTIICLILILSGLTGLLWLIRLYFRKSKIHQIREFKGIVLSKQKLESMESIRHYPSHYGHMHMLPLEYAITLPPRNLVRVQMENLEMIVLNNEEVFDKLDIGDKVELIVEEISNKKGKVLEYKPLQLLSPFHEVLCQDE